jgi:hypothetical protein
MMSPYTAQPFDAYMAAQTSAGVVLAALVWFRPMRSRLATGLLFAAVALAVLAPVSGDFLNGIGITVAPTHTKRILKAASVLASAAALATRRPPVVAVALLGTAGLWPITNYIEDCDWDLAAAYLALFGLIAGVHWRTLPADPPAGNPRGSLAKRPAWIDDLAAFVLGTLAGAIVCRVLLHGRTSTADEWGYTFQAALFAKLRAYGSVPHCGEAFRNFWVFQYMGRSFAQYTPGWPYFMAPFAALRVVWLAGPASLGLLAAGVSRLGRRAAEGFSPGTTPPSPSLVRAAGRFAALAVLLGSTMLINGGSRFPHLFVGAMFAWAIEALLTISTGTLPSREQWRWGVVLGASSSMMVAARPADGCTLGIGLFVYFAYALARRRMGWRAISGAAAVFATVGGLTLVILRLQLGTWFATGYSLTTTIYPWVDFKWSLPKPNEYKVGIPLATGAYCWWPCSPAVGLAGIGALRGRASRIGFIFLFGYLPFVAFYTLLEFGRGFDFGYGPRYELPWVVPMAVGTGVVLAHLWSAARAHRADVSALEAGGPAAIALAAVVLGVVRIAPLVFPPAYADVKSSNQLHEALDELSLHHAIVLGNYGLNVTDPMNLTENLPMDLYPDQDVLIAIDRGPELVSCVRRFYPFRTLYRALPGASVQIVPY